MSNTNKKTTGTTNPVATSASSDQKAAPAEREKPKPIKLKHPSDEKFTEAVHGVEFKNGVAETTDARRAETLRRVWGFQLVD